jgi:hypothetical protein
MRCPLDRDRSPCAIAGQSPQPAPGTGHQPEVVFHMICFRSRSRISGCCRVRCWRPPTARRRRANTRPSSSTMPSGRSSTHRPRAGMACVPRRPCAPQPTEGHVGDRALPNVGLQPTGSSRGGVGRSCRTLRGLRPPAHLLQLLPQPALPEVSGRRCQGVAGRPPGRTPAGAPGLRRGRLYFHLVFTLPAPIGDIAYQNKAVVMTCCSRPPPRP